MLILDGKRVRDFRAGLLIERVRGLSRVPTLALFQVGDDPASSAYIAQKKAFAERIGARVIHRHFPVDASFDEISAAIRADNDDPSVHGIILQLPVPAHLSANSLIDLISPLKDVDGLTSENQALLAEGRPRYVPATARAVSAILDFYNIPVKGKKVVVLGRSRLVGSPTALLLSAQGGEVTVCHSKTENTKGIARTADILVVAIGKPGLIGAEYVREGAIVIDVGITRVDGRLMGDVDHTAVESLASAMTPVPGGVGPVTVLSLFDTLVESVDYRI
jgi:methylenetetrahydrofolate dehydrogenase (NADP+)/methenyltetrahydrofolate cyclohydrolase